MDRDDLVAAAETLDTDELADIAEDLPREVIDEVREGLSLEERGAVQNLIAAIPRETTIIMIEHDMDVALEYAERITLLHYGEVLVDGTRTDVVNNPRTREVYLGN